MINSYLTELSKKLITAPENRAKIDTSISHLEGKIFERFRDKLLKVEVFGSYDRRTELPQSIDLKSDVDVMVIFKKDEYTPDTFLKHLRDFADKTYPRSEVSPDHPAITVQLNHIRFELVPAYWETFLIWKDELRIPAPRTSETKWIETAPQDFKKVLEIKNQEENGMLVPLIKIIKYLSTIHGSPYESFTIENFILNCRYPNSIKELKDYVLGVIDAMTIEGQNEKQAEFVNQLKYRRKNILHLQQGTLNEYLAQELQLFLPYPS